MEPGVAASVTRDCRPHAPPALSLTVRQGKETLEALGHAPPGSAADTTRAVSNVVPVHVSMVRVPPGGEPAGTVMRFRVSPASAPGASSPQKRTAEVAPAVVPEMVPEAPGSARHCGTAPGVREGEGTATDQRSV